MESCIHTERILRWNSGLAPFPGPIRLTMFPTNICNIKCRHCWQRWADYDKTYKSELSDERLLALVDEAAELGVVDWYFVGGGEPMARGKLVIAMCERIRQLGMNGHIHTNGTLFRPGMLEKLIEIGWQQVRVSLDGADAQTNDYIRSGGFDKAVANIRRLSELKREKDAHLPDIAIYMTATTLTCDKIVEFVELAHSLGPDVHAELSGLIVQSEGSAALELTPAQVEKYPDYVRAGLKRARELGVETNFEDYLAKELVQDTMMMHQNKHHKERSFGGTLRDAVCHEPWTSASLLPDGKFGPCCAFFDENALSIKDHSLADVWYGAYMQEVRRGMVTGNPPSYCDRCPSNLYVHKEQMREIYAESLAKQDRWADMNSAAKVAYLVSRAARSMREVGMKGTVERTANWLKLRRVPRAS
ncbi:MAG: radical SAM protein [Candidatus Hydrogenedentes bacterium]|nr:radical SAM protein [Candidatus Hydrogenedentota bacterium]